MSAPKLEITKIILTEMEFKIPKKSAINGDINELKIIRKLKIVVTMMKGSQTKVSTTPNNEVRPTSAKIYGVVVKNIPIKVETKKAENFFFLK